MRAPHIAFGFSICLAASLLAACGGGGGGGGAALPPVASVTGGSPGSSAGSPAAVAISIAVPAPSTSSSKRRARYVSAATKSITVGYGSGSQTVDCTATCSLVVNVMPGPVTFAVGLYDAAGGTGHLLSSGQTTTTIVPGQNTVKMTFSGVAAALSVALGTASVSAGTPATIPVVVTAKDAAGYTIVGSEPYASPIALALDDSSGATSLSTTTVSAPGASVTLAYNGSASLAAARVSASIPGAGIAAPAATLSVQAPAAPPATGPVPAHIGTWYYYGLDDVNASIPASWMVAHADYVEDDGFDAKHAQAFKSAGGKYAVAYTDPTFVPYCYAPFAPPAGRCEGPIGNLVAADESAWFHGADGARVHRFVDDHFQYQEALNPAAASARAAFHQTTAALIAAAPAVDYVFGDDAGGTLTGGDGTQLTGWLFGFNAGATEITRDADFIAAEQQMLASATRPVFLNGATPYTHMPAYNGTFLTSPNVVGQNFEGCYGEYGGLLADGSAGARWTMQGNALLAVYAHRTTAICMDESPATTTNRIYVLASLWLTYAEPYTVVAPQGKTADGLTVRPEFDIVPRQPRTSATSDVAVLRAPGGAYVREFTACYQAGAPIGPCAAVVNPGSAPVAIPALTGRYTGALALDDRSAYGGGAAAWTASVPAQLAAQSAVLLR
jgi:hypothetical protein